MNRQSYARAVAVSDANQNHGPAAGSSRPPSPSHRPGTIQLRLRDVSQLFNSMDPSPFHEKDLDQDAEEFIVSWAMEFSVHQPLSLVVELRQPPDDPRQLEVVEPAIQHFFQYKAELTRREFRQLLKHGRLSLLIGLMFLAACVGAGELLAHLTDSPLLKIAQEGLLIGGWVAMWHPMQIFLYDWWPLRHRRRMFDNMGSMPVRVDAGG